MYTSMIDKVYRKEKVNLECYLAELEGLVNQEAKSNHAGWVYPTDEELLAAYKNSSLLDYI